MGKIDIQKDEVTISQSRYKTLLKCERQLSALMEAGVYLWEGIPLAEKFLELREKEEN